jgi:hypothetical protein
MHGHAHEHDGGEDEAERQGEGADSIATIARAPLSGVARSSR